MTVSNIAATGYNPPSPFQAAGNLVGVAQGVQNYQTGQLAQQQRAIELQSQQQANQERQAVVQAMQNGDPDLKAGSDGIIDQPKAIAKLQQLAPQTWGQYAQTINQSNSQATAVNSQLLGLGQEKLNDLSKVAGALAVTGTRESDIADQLGEYAKANPKAAGPVSQLMAQVKATNGDPAKIQAIMLHAAMRTSTLADSQAAQTVNLQGVNTGQQQNFFNVKPGVQGSPVGALVAQFQNQPPPTTPVMHGNTPVLLGAMTPEQQSTAGAGIQAAPSLGQAETVSTMGVQPAAQDWQKTIGDAQRAAQDIGVLQNIKRYAAGAIMGVASDRAAYAAGLAGYLGISPAELAKTNTDLLAKNSAMLALAGGNTDAARSLAEVMNPHATMTPEAATHAADQIIAQRALPIVKQQVFNGLNQNPEAYQQKLTQWNQVADPRILQWSSMTPQEKSEMKAAMTPAEREKFKQQMRGFESLVGGK